MGFGSDLRFRKPHFAICIFCPFSCVDSANGIENDHSWHSPIVTNYPNSVSQRPQVALLIETSNAYSRGLLRGIRTYMREGADWEIHFTEQGRGDEPPPWFHNWSGDGIIARIENQRIEDAVVSANLPVVNVSTASLRRSFPSVASSSDGVSRLAAEHLVDRGFQSFGFCGDARFDWSFRHEHNFGRYLKAAGFVVDSFDTKLGDADDWQLEQDKLIQWVSQIAKPTGIFA